MKLNFDLLWKHERWKRQRKILRVRLFVGTAENDPSMLLGEGKARLFREKKHRAFGAKTFGTREVQFFPHNSDAS